jgi:ABC-type glycerol-3-phosphate transport system substrate-binding protein
VKTSVTQMVILGVFVLFLVVGVFIFATYGTSNSGKTAAQINIWGTLSTSDVSKVIASIKDKYRNQTIPFMNYTEIKKDDFQNTLTEALADGSGPDVILISSDLIVSNQKRLTTIGYDLIPLRDFKDSFIEGSEILLTSTGTLGVPLIVDPLVMYWNRDILTSKGVARPPVTWEEMLSIIDRLTERREDKSIVKSALAFGDFSNIKYAKDILITLIIQAGGQLVGRDEADKLVNLFLNVKIEDVYPISSSISFFTQFADPLKPTYSWNRSLADSEKSFLNGDLAFYFAPASEKGSIRAKSPNLNFDVAEVPQPRGSSVKKTTGDVYSFSILNSSVNKQEAFGAISLLTDSTASKLFSDITMLPSARRDVLQVGSDSMIESVFIRSSLWTFPWLDPNPMVTNNIFGSAVDSIVTGKLKNENISGFISSQMDELIR